jgi:type IV pilus assembly protein PilX
MTLNIEPSLWKQCSLVTEAKRMKSVKITNQRGAALITSLLMVVVISILGVGISQQVIALRKVSAVNYDQTLSFNRAESALLAAQSAITQVFSDPTAIQAMATDTNTDANWWKDKGNWDEAIEISNIVSSEESKPSYLIRDNGTNNVMIGTDSLTRRFYRVTTQAQGKGESAVFLQSYYATVE